MEVSGSGEAVNSQVNVLNEVAGLISQAVGLGLKTGAEEHFLLEGGGGTGITRAEGRLENQALICVRLEVLKTPADSRLSARRVFHHLSSLGERTRIVSAGTGDTGDSTSLWVEIRIQASPLSLGRTSALLREIATIQEMARELQADIPEALSNEALTKQYAEVADVLEPISPMPKVEQVADAAEREWAVASLDYMNGGLPVALVVQDRIVEDYCLGLLASACARRGGSLGRLLLPVINAKGLMDVSRKAPGAVVVPAVRIHLGSNVYDLAGEIHSLLECLASAEKPVLFTGTYEQLQKVFQGGQGGWVDPKWPVVRWAPEIPLARMVPFAVEGAGNGAAFLSARDKAALSKEILEQLSLLPASMAGGLLPVVAKRETNIRAGGCAGGFPPTEAFVEEVALLKETFCGMAAKGRAARSPHVQGRWVRVLAGGDLSEHLRRHLFAQDEAIDSLALHLRKEVLTRPDHQPLRYCAQGMPGTGKSRSAQLVAGMLDIPYVNIDAASMPDYYTAAAQLLGSGRGIVGSHKSGRLEEAAKHHAGALVEISDLDHAVPGVRAALADLFLQVLENGEAQSASGAMFSCAGLVLAFTVNLPDGLDERIRKGIGFGDGEDRRAVRKRVSRELKQIFSGAFVSRVGSPIVFEPLSGTALRLIVEKAIADSVELAAVRLEAGLEGISIDEGVAPMVLGTMESRDGASGARAIVEHTRGLVSGALLDFLSGRSRPAGLRLRVEPGADGASLRIVSDLLEDRRSL